MKRFITCKLAAWKAQVKRKPLIVRGARQVGKTWSIMEFGKQCFGGKVHLVDLEKHPDWHRIFERDLNAGRIVSELEILLNTAIVPGQDLLFFDEIQSCPRAITALRYFYEELPDLHLIAAGSLLEFAMRTVSFPVGRVQFITMFPMSFAEFLMAGGMEPAAEVVTHRPEKQPDSIHAKLLDELRRYFIVGGMPECVISHFQSGSLKRVSEVQAQLINAYREDFAKYAPQVDKRCLNDVFAAVAKSVGQQIKYSRLTEGFTHPTVKKAFDLLCMARVIQKVPAANPAGFPLGASVSERRFKALFLDIGLMQHVCRMPIDVEFAKTDLLAMYQGALAEQFVGQEVLAAGQEELYYWAREAKGSSAEVDFLIVTNGRIFPVEVKSGPSGRLKSLHLLLRSCANCHTGYVFSGAPYAELPAQKIVFIPLYYAYAMGAEQ